MNQDQVTVTSYKQTHEGRLCSNCGCSLIRIETDKGSVTKPHALEQLNADLVAYNSDISAVSETWFKKHHTDKLVNVNGTFYIERIVRRRAVGLPFMLPIE